MNRITVLSICASIAFLLYIVEMVRRRKLQEEYSILWLSGSVVLLVLSVKQDWLNRIAAAVGIAYPPSLLFLVGMFFIVLILIHFSITISKLKQVNKQIAQEIALMKHAPPAEDPSGTRGNRRA